MLDVGRHFLARRTYAVSIASLLPRARATLRAISLAVDGRPDGPAQTCFNTWHPAYQAPSGGMCLRNTMSQGILLILCYNRRRSQLGPPQYPAIPQQYGHAMVDTSRASSPSIKASPLFDICLRLCLKLNVEAL
ncbi:MAG: hypothetical protein FRX48_02361 [Lasallia pustulata]|uniref:Uncharacterized protein n=1 Tax=Lasallia pustulata TaxID=136370 RepID=A0A5M8PY74_9LECA|nr:MAG: hypothetical protein FRX48_02361 [Lasallia pustulata]